MLLIDSRRADVEALWRDQPAARQTRAEVFAELGAQFFVERYVHGDAAERADIVVVAEHLCGCSRELVQIMRSDRSGGSSQRNAAAALHRIVVRSARKAIRPRVEAQRRLQGTPDEASLERLESLGSEIGPAAFALADLLTDKDIKLRARAAVALRRAMDLPVPEGLLIAWAEGPAGHLWSCPPVVRLTDANVEEVFLPTLARDADAPILGFLLHPELGVGSGAVSPHTRTRLAEALTAAGLRVPLDPVPVRGSLPSGRPRYPGTTVADARASALFGAAARLGADKPQYVLSVASTTPEPRSARRVIEGLLAARVLQPDVVRGLAPIVAALLDHADEGVAMLAARMAERLLAIGEAPELRERLVAKAIAALVKDGQVIALGPPLFGGGTMLEVPDAPDGFSAQVVRAAASTRAPPLLKPLIAELERLLSAPAVNAGADPGRSHRWLALQCLSLLAPTASPDQAIALHTLLGKKLEQLMTEAVLRRVSREQFLVADVIYGLFPVVPEHLLPWYDSLLAGPHQRRACARVLENVANAVPEDRLRRLLRSVWLWEYPRLYLRVPDLLVDAWNAGGEARNAALGVVVAAMQRDRTAVLELVRRGTLPREFAAAAVRPVHMRGDWRLADLVEILPEGTFGAGAWASTLEHAIKEAQVDDSEVDLTALKRLASSAIPNIAMTAASRAATLGKAGRACASDTLARFIESQDLERKKAAIKLAITSGVHVPGVLAAVSGMRRSSDSLARTLADAAELRFGGLDPRRMQSRQPGEAIALAKIDVDVDTLRAVFGERLALHLPSLLYDCSAVTRASGLLLAAELEFWDERLEGRVVSGTNDNDARVRRAAYSALRSRDPELWQCAWLVHEAFFDPDPSVRTLGR